MDDKKKKLKARLVLRVKSKVLTLRLFSPFFFIRFFSVNVYRREKDYNTFLFLIFFQWQSGSLQDKEKQSKGKNKSRKKSWRHLF